MNAEELLEQLELNYSKQRFERIYKACAENPELLEFLIKLVSKGRGRQAQLASWILSKVTDINAELVAVHFKILIKLINHTTITSVKRNVIRTFIYIEIPENYHAELIDSCFKTLIHREYSIAERSFSLNVLGKYVKLYPELSNELIPIIEEGMPYESSAFRSAGNRILKKIRR